MKSCAIIGGFVSLSFALVSAAPSNVTEAVPLQAIPAILDLFKTYEVAGLGDPPIAWESSRSNTLTESVLHRMATEAAVKDPSQPDTQKDEYLPDARYAHKDRKDAADHAGVNPRDTSSMPRGEEDDKTRANSPEFHDRPPISRATD